MLSAGTVVLLLAAWFGQAALPGWFVLDLSPGADVYHLSTIYGVWAGHLLAGAPPLWFPEFQGGFPAAAPWMYGLWYPGWLLFAVMPAELAWSWTAIGHAALGAAGMHQLVASRGARPAAAACAALLFGVSEWFVGKTACGHLNLISPVAWAPWVFLAASAAVRGRRGAVGGLGLALGLGLLAGHVQLWFYLGPALVAFIVLESRALAGGSGALLPALGRVAAGCGLGCAVALVQIVPAAELALLAAPAPQSGQMLLAASAGAAEFAARALGMPWSGAVPGTGADAGLSHEAIGIAGLHLVPLLALALGGGGGREWRRRALPFAAFALAGGLLAAAPHLGLGALYALPPLSAARTPGRAMVLVLFGAAAAAGLGVERWLAADWGEAQRRRALTRAALLTVAVAAMAAVTLRLASVEAPVGARLPSGALAALAASLVIAALAWVGREPRRAILLPLACTVAALGAGVAPVRAVSAGFFHADWAAALPAALRAQRVHLVSSRLPPLELAGLRTLRPVTHAEFDGMKQVLALPLPVAARWLDIGASVDAPIAEVLSGRLVPGLLAPARMPVGEPLNEGARWFPGAVAAADGEAAERLRGGADLLVIAAPAGAVAGAPGPGADAVRRLPPAAPDRLSYEVEAPAAGWLFTSERWYPGWTATVNGHPVPVARANLAFRAAPTPAGRSRVEFRYAPWWWPGAGIVSLGAALAAGGLSLRRQGP